MEAFYEAYNTRDLDTIANLVAEDVLYHDLQYPDPHCGRGAVLKWLEKVKYDIFISLLASCLQLACLMVCGRCHLLAMYGCATCAGPSNSMRVMTHSNYVAMAHVFMYFCYDHMAQVRKYAPDDLRFCIDDITDGDPSKVGVKW